MKERYSVIVTDALDKGLKETREKLRREMEAWAKIGIEGWEDDRIVSGLERGLTILKRRLRGVVGEKGGKGR